MKDYDYKLYGITTILGMPCLCYGKNAFFCVITWAKKLKRFKIYTGRTTANDVVKNICNTKKWRFFGIVKIIKTKLQ